MKISAKIVSQIWVISVLETDEFWVNYWDPIIDLRKPDKKVLRSRGLKMLVSGRAANSQSGKYLATWKMLCCHSMRMIIHRSICFLPFFLQMKVFKRSHLSSSHFPLYLWYIFPQSWLPSLLGSPGYQFSKFAADPSLQTQFPSGLMSLIPSQGSEPVSNWYRKLFSPLEWIDVRWPFSCWQWTSAADQASWFSKSL